KEMNVTPGYISNVENGRTAMSLRFLIYYAGLMGITLDELVGNLEPEYKNTSLDNSLQHEISKLSTEEKEKLLKTIKIWNN
ncbi:MAG: helix-turn-helix transcriptional regulator, partial [Lachnospiraceae bacterium]|nr:helix-turn-helix transcriptional regulator [Lachnospiraceae bacterium]